MTEASFYIFVAGLIAGVLICWLTLRLVYAKKTLKLINAVKQLSSLNDSRRPASSFTKDTRVLFHLIQRIISELKSGRAASENERKKLTTILDSMSEGMIAVDAHSQILLINPSALSIFSVSKPDATGKRLLEIVKNEALDSMMSQAIREKSVVSKDIEIFRDQKKFLQASAVGIANSESNTVCGILVLYDLTEIRKLENVRREFVANVSHELRTPMTSILGFIETLLSEPKIEKDREQHFLKLMEEDAKRLGRLIDDLLELSKIESRSAPLNLEPVNLAEEIKTVIATLEPAWMPKRLTIHKKMAPNLSMLRADRDQIKQVLLNLLDNAIKFNHAGGEIFVELKYSNSEQTVSIRDTGNGIPPESIPRIFERFYRVDKARSRELGGTGLGLAIVKHIIEAHGGRVSCASQPGQGTTFSFSLPIRP